MTDGNLVKKLTVTGPGQVFYQCHILRDIENYEKQNKYLTGWQLDLSQPNYKYCVPRGATEQQMKDWISEVFPERSPEEQQALQERVISLSRAFTEAFPKDFTPYLDARYDFRLSTRDGTTLNWLVYEYEHSDGQPFRNSLFIEALDIPLSTSTPNPTP